MRKLVIALLGIVFLIALVPVGLVLSGTISGSSLRMVLNVMTGAAGPPADEATVKQRYQVPDGFTVSLYAGDLPRARFLRFTPAGDLLVSRPHAGDIVLLRRDENGDGAPDAVETLVSELSRPLGLDFHNDTLYIAQSDRITRVAFDAERGALAGALEDIVTGLTDNGNHWSKTLRVGPDNMLYLAQGSTCNICEEDDRRRATMMRFALDGSGAEIFATGLRNSVGFDWSPTDGQLYATDNGRDLLGDDFPPCELNRVEQDGFYGWPYFNGNNIPDPDMGADPQAATRSPVAPVFDFPAHNAPLGIHFLKHGDTPADYRDAALVALHGSWNRSSPDGYKVVSLHWRDGAIETRDFLSGFLHDGDISGRPVDVAQGPDGAIYISDDFAGAVYRVTYGTQTAGAALASAIGDGAQDNAPPDWLAGADTAAIYAQGKQLYTQHNCASCHEMGINPKRLENLAERRSYNDVMDALAAPQAPMPIYPLEEGEQRALAHYLMEN